MQNEPEPVPLEVSDMAYALGSGGDRLTATKLREMEREWLEHAAPVFNAEIQKIVDTMLAPLIERAARIIASHTPTPSTEDRSSTVAGSG